MFRYRFAMLMLLAVPASATAEPPVVEVGKLSFVFAEPATGRKILGARDAFVSRLSTFDRQARMQSPTEVSNESYLEFVSQQVRPWQPDQQAKLSEVLQDLAAPLSGMSFPKLSKVELVQTTGREEGEAAYTRSNAIVLPRSKIELPPRALRKLLLHELFHVVSRTDAKLRDELYAVLGFRPSNEIQLPAEWQSRRLTNPDAPVIEHVMTVQLAKHEQRHVAPVLFASSPYDPEESRSMFAYLKFQLLQVVPNEQGDYEAAEEQGQPLWLSPTLADFRRQIGGNTGYIIHPEEVLADNFVALVLETEGLPDPWILKKMAKILRR